MSPWGRPYLAIVWSGHLRAVILWGLQPEFSICLPVLILERFWTGDWWLLPHNGLLGMLLAIQVGAMCQAHSPHHLPAAACTRGAAAQQGALAALGAQECILFVLELQQFGSYLLITTHI